MTLAAALPLTSLLWMTPPAVAHDGYQHYRHRPAWSESYRRPPYGRYHNLIGTGAAVTVPLGNMGKIPGNTTKR
jgi:hypothetical protein